MKNDFLTSRKITPDMKAECMALDKPIAEEDPCPECASSLTPLQDLFTSMREYANESRI
jgi:hypothetical protein